MAKVKGPFLSAEASGSIAKRLTARRTPLGTVMLSWSKPGLRKPSPPSSAQLAHRAIYGALVASWRALSQGQRDQYDALALPFAISGWNYFLKEGINLPPTARALEDGSLLLLQNGSYRLLES